MNIAWMITNNMPLEMPLEMPSMPSKTSSASKHCNVVNDMLIMSLKQLRNKYPYYSIRCGIILIREDDGRILIVKEKPRGDFNGNVYGFPKGSARQSDSEFFSVACRELFEETGISARDAEKIDLEFIMFHRHFHEIMFLFPMLIKTPPDPQPDPREIAGCYWMSLDELKDRAGAESSFTRRFISDIYTLLLSGLPVPDHFSGSVSSRQDHFQGSA